MLFSNYSFNGKEKDDEVYGDGNFQDYGLRCYDNRLGRFFSVDPLAASYPWNSTYAFAENDVVRSIDLDGAEKFIQITMFNPQQNSNKSKIVLIRYSQLFPGKAHGPWGETGTVRYSYDLLSKKTKYKGYDSRADDELAYRNGVPILVKEKGSPTAPTNTPTGEVDGQTQPVITNDSETETEAGGDKIPDVNPSPKGENPFDKFFDNIFKKKDPNKQTDTVGYKVYTNKETGDTADVVDTKSKEYHLKKGTAGYNKMLKDTKDAGNKTKIKK